jgi:dATP pyrophosphohydrolase
MMARAPFQVLVIPYRYAADRMLEYCLLKRSDTGIWQFVAGGGEGSETPQEAAQRELQEETGCCGEQAFVQLDTSFSVPVTAFSDRVSWPVDLYVIPCSCYGVFLGQMEVRLSSEHSASCWLPYALAYDKLHFGNNRTALWELNERLLRL